MPSPILFLATSFKQPYHLCVPSDQNAPATKQDIQQFIEHIQRLIADMEERMEERMEQMEERITKEDKETRHHFNVVAENIKHDFLHGALPDHAVQLRDCTAQQD